jgi:hypothetical protein
MLLLLMTAKEAPAADHCQIYVTLLPGSAAVGTALTTLLL